MQVRLLGYEIENHRDAKGCDCGFEIRGVSDELLTRFSRRSRQRDQAIARFVARNGRKPSDNEVAVPVRESRADKPVEISTEELRARQRARLTPEEARTLPELRPVRHAAAIPSSSAHPSFEYAKEDVFERVSVSRDHEILAEALRHGRGPDQPPGIEGHPDLGGVHPATSYATATRSPQGGPLWELISPKAKDGDLPAQHRKR